MVKGGQGDRSLFGRVDEEIPVDKAGQSWGSVNEFLIEVPVSMVEKVMHLCVKSSNAQSHLMRHFFLLPRLKQGEAFDEASALSLSVRALSRQE